MGKPTNWRTPVKGKHIKHSMAMTGVLLGVVVLMLCKVYMDSNQWWNYKRVCGPTTGINFKESDERGWSVKK